MANAKKCDLCGVFYMPKEKDPKIEKGKKTFVLSKYDEEGFFDRQYDFCPKCQEKFEAVVWEFLKREMFEQLEID